MLNRMVKIQKNNMVRVLENIKLSTPKIYGMKYLRNQ